MSKDLGKMLSAGGKGLLGGMSAYGQDNPLAGAMGGLSGLGMAGSPLSGVGLMEALFKKLGIFGNDKKEDETPGMNPNGNFVGPRY